MASFSSFTQNNPLSATPQTTLQKIGSAISTVPSKIGQAFTGGLKNSLNSAKAIPGDIISANGPKAIMDTTGIAGGLGQAAMSPITGVLNATGAPDAVNNNIVQPTANAISNIPAVQKFAGSETGQATGQLVQAGQNTLDFAGGVGTASGAFGKISDLATDHPIFKSSADIISGRTADATPAYDKDLIGTNIKTPTGEIAPRINEGEGMFGKRTVTTSASEAEQGNELANVENYPDKGTSLEKSQAVGTAIGKEAENMRSGLQAEDQAKPLDVAAQKSKIMSIVKENLPADIQHTLGMLSPEDEAFMNDISKNAGTPLPKGGFKNDPNMTANTVSPLPKTAMGKYVKSVSNAIENFNGTREGILDLRQQIDSAYKSSRGNLAFGNDSANELDNTNTDIRNALNKALAETTQDTNSQASLKKQSNLYRAKDTLEVKAKVEANSAINRLAKAHPFIATILRRELTRAVIAGAGGALLISEINKLVKGN